MKPLTFTTRLIAIVTSAAVTAGLFATVASFAEPQRSALLAKNSEARKPATVLPASRKLADAR